MERPRFRRLGGLPADCERQGARAGEKNKGPTDGRWNDSCPDASARGLDGEARDASASTDRYVTTQDSESEEMTTDVKKMGDGKMKIYSDWMRRGWFSASGEKAISAELMRRGFSVPGFEPLTINVKEEGDDESSGRPPSY